MSFVVQKHAARRLHYDFRLEVAGTLKSWAVPKGPSLDPQEKRLAVMVEDHPLEYATFEGVIAHGNYGAGQVIVWDSGIYSPDENGRLSFGDRGEAEERMRLDLERGKVSITLRGHKLRGSWTLVRTSRSPKDWLLIKHRDKYTDPERDVLKDERSAQSGLTIADLKGGRLPDPVRSPVVSQELGTDKIMGMGKSAPFPSSLKPMLARILDEPFSHPEWLFEPKLDGYRVVAFVREGEITLRSRNGINITKNLPMIVGELETQPEREFVLDGEIVALNEDGLPDFGLLQQSMRLDKPGSARMSTTATIAYYPFDILFINGRDLRQVPLVDRKRLLSQVLIPGDHLHPVDHIDSDGESFFQAAVGLGLEGMVAKRRDSRYEPGSRSRSWLKVKTVQDQDFVVGGYTRGSGERSGTFGALLVGYYEGTKLHYAGRVGSGFDQNVLQELYESLSLLDTDKRPFIEDSELNTIDARWIRPKLVARVKFAQWTDEGRLRAPVFTGLRSDLDPKGVTLEIKEAPIVPDEFKLGLEQDFMHAETEEVLAQLSGNQASLILEVAGQRISLTNLNKPLWPGVEGEPPVTKGDLVRYYARMAPHLLPHLRHRPLTLTRYPSGIHGKSFYQKHWGQEKPEFVETVRLFSSHREGDVEFIMANNIPTIIWLAQLANIELHPWLSRTLLDPDATQLPAIFTGSKENIENSVLNYPDFIVFDLDPYIYSGKEKAGGEPELNRLAFSKVVQVAFALKDILDQLSLSSFLKTSGKTGLHIYVPILRQYDYAITRKNCELIGRFVMQQRLRDVTMEWTVSKRPEKIFLDHNQNSRSKNMASIYSLRPLDGAPVSTSLRWDELETIYPTDFTIETVPDRVEKLGDLWAEILQSKHDLHRLLDAP